MDHSQVIRGRGGVSPSVPNKFKILEIIAVSSQIDMGTYVIEVKQFKFKARVTSEAIGSLVRPQDSTKT